jgi:hypothetical protein
VEAASIEELHQKIQTLEKENNKEEEYRNYMQLERVGSSMAVSPQHAITLPQGVAGRQQLVVHVCAVHAGSATHHQQHQ